MLAAADAAVMVLDAAKGIEPQTLKLFDVCRQRGLPAAHLHQQVGPARPRRRSSCSTRSSSRSASRPTPVTWPVGIAGDFRGVVDRRSGEFTRFTRVGPRRHRGARGARRRRPGRRRGGRRRGRRRPDELELLDGVGADLDLKAFLAGESTPVFFGSALTNFGVRKLLDAVDRPGARPRRPATDVDGVPRPLDAPFSGFVFKVQANMDPSHRDRIAFLRVCSGRFERGMVVTHEPHRQAVRHQVRPPGVRPGARDDRGGLPRRRRRPGQRHRRAGRRHALRRRAGRRFPAIPSFAPEHFSVDPGARHRPVQAVPPGHRPARRGGRRAGAARPRPRRPGARARRGRARCSSRWRSTGSRTSSARRSS